jgi:hypothetical protein
MRAAGVMDYIVAIKTKMKPLHESVLKRIHVAAGRQNGPNNELLRTEAAARRRG